MSNSVKDIRAGRLTHEQVAVVLGISRPTVYAKIKSGKLKTTLTPDDVSAYIGREQEKLNEMRERLAYFSR